MLPCSMVLCAEGEGGETALIDQRAVAAGKNWFREGERDRGRQEGEGERERETRGGDGRRENI